MKCLRRHPTLTRRAQVPEVHLVQNSAGPVEGDSLRQREPHPPTRCIRDFLPFTGPLERIQCFIEAFVVRGFVPVVVHVNRLLVDDRLEGFIRVRERRHAVISHLGHRDVGGER